MLNAIAFVVLACAILIGAFSVVSVRNVMHAAYWLLEVAFAVAGLLWFMSAEYLAILQLLVYVSAVGVLILFTIMLTRRDPMDAERPVALSVFGLIAAVVFFGLMAYGILQSPTLAASNGQAVAATLEAFGREMFTLSGWSLAFEIASLLLTVALIAAVWWTKERDK